MAGSTAQLLIQVRADAGQATAVLNELTMQTRQLEQIMANTSGNVSKAVSTAESAGSSKGSGFLSNLAEQFTGIGKLALGFATGNLIASATMGLEEQFKNAAESVDIYGKAVLQVQRITGESAESSSALVAIFERYSPSIDSATTRLGRFEKNLGAIETGGGKQAAAALTEFGVQAMDANGKLRPTTEILLDLAQGFHNSGDAALKNEALVALFGRGSQDLLLMLNQGRDGLQNFVAEAQREGLVLSQDNVSDVAQYIAAHKEMDLALQGLTIQLGAAFMPAITDASKYMTNLAKEMTTTVVPAIHEVANAILDFKSKIDSLQSQSGFGQGTKDFLGTVLEHTPIIGDAMSVWKQLHPDSGKLDTAGAGSDATGTAEEPGTPSAVIQSATAAVDNAKSNLQTIEDAAAQRKAGFDMAHLDAEQQALALKMQQSEAEQELLAYKQQIQDIDRQAVDFAAQRKALDDQDAVTMAKLSESPLKQQSDTLQYQEDRLKAQVAAARAGGAPVNMDAARRQIADIERQKALMGPALIDAEHQVRSASETQSDDQMQKSLHDNAAARAKVDIQQSMQPLNDEATARQRAAESAQQLLDLDRQRFTLSELAYKSQELLAQAAQKAAEHTLFVLEHPIGAYGPQPVAQATQPQLGPTTEMPGKTFAESHPELWNEQPNQTWGQSHNVQVAVDVTHNATDEGALLDKVWQHFVAAWDQAMQHAPVNGQLGGSYTGIAGR